MFFDEFKNIRKDWHNDVSNMNNFYFEEYEKYGRKMILLSWNTGSGLLTSQIPYVNIFTGYMNEKQSVEPEFCNICFNDTYKYMECCRCKNSCCIQCFKRLKNRRICSYCKYSLYDVIRKKRKILIMSMFKFCFNSNPIILSMNY